MPLEAGIRTVESWAFRVGRLLDLNDPFEWRMGVVGIREGAEAMAAHLMQTICAQHNEQFGVLCFSDTADDPVLWSHYADRHRGIAIEVEHDLLPGVLHQIEYTDVRPNIDANRVVRPEYQDEIRSRIEQLIRTKSCGWKYEQEWRVYIPLEECDARGGYYFKPIPPDFVCRIILGAEATIGTAYFQKLLRQNQCESVPVVRARKSPHTFKIVY